MKERFCIEKLIPDFKGLARDKNGKAVIIDKALSGEVVDARITKVYKNYSLASAINIIKPSLERDEPDCKYFNKCGSCQLLHIKREVEEKYKLIFFKELFKGFYNVKFEDPVFLNRFKARTRVKFHISNGKIGFMQSKTNEIIDIDKCPLLCDELNQRLCSLKNSNAKLKNGDMQFLYSSNGKIQLGNCIYSVDNDVFFQSNLAIAEKLLDYVSDNCSFGNVLDVYAGIGFFSQKLEKNPNIKSIVAIEENKKCLRHAKTNLKNSDYLNIPFEKLDTKALLKKIKHIDACIIDPPRNGLSAMALKKLLSLNPDKIIYVSCNIKSNINDIKKICEYGYAIKSAKLFDMYPATVHIESVVILESI